MDTTLLLMAQYKQAVIPLKDICEKYFGLSYEKARREASLNQLPVPTVRLADSQKAPLGVRVQDLAELIDQRATVAKQQWERSQA